MSSLVLDLQAEALDSKVPIGDLLRKASVIAKKLKITEFQAWIENEQNGYNRAEDIPPYRTVRGRIVAWNPMRGWVDVGFANAALAEKLSVRDCGQAISEIEHLAKQDPSGWLGMPFPPEVEKKLMELQRPISLTPSLHVQHAVLARILEGVRNTVLNWAIKLEEDGILGTGVTFSSEERQIAASHTYNVSIFAGPVIGSQIQQGTSGSNQQNRSES